MSNKRIKDLPIATSTSPGDTLPIDGTNTRGITVENFLGGNLDAIKGLTSAADKGIQFTGSGTAATFDLTSAGRAILDDADAAAQRTTLGLGNVQNVDTTNAGNISSGTLALARLPTFTQNGTGAVARTYDAKLRDVIYAKDFGVKADALKITATVSITSGTKNLTATGASFTAADVGKTIFVQGAGAAGAYLQSTIVTFTDSSHVVLNDNAGTTVTAASKIVLYGTDDATALTAARDAARNGPYTLVLTGGRIFTSASINWAYNNLHVTCVSDDCSIYYIGTGTKGHQFDGMANYPGTQGCVDGRFGGPCTPRLHGNPVGTTTNGVWVDNYHFGHLQFRPRDATNALVLNDSGVVGASAVCTRFENIRASNNADGPYIVQPNAGVVANKTVACTWNDLIVEGCGAGSGAVQLIGCINNSFRGGTVESNGSKGLVEDSASSRNTFTNIDCEANTTHEWAMSGKHSVLINCTGAVVASSFAGTGAILLGGSYQAVTATDATFHSVNTEFYGTCSLTGANRVVTAPQGSAAGVTAIAVDASSALPQQKNINTDNGNTIQIASIDIASAWTTYTPTITAGGGTPTTVSATGRYKQVGKVVTAEVDVTVTTVGTASGGLNFSLPINARASRYVGSSFEYGATGKGGAAYINGPSGPSLAVTKAADGTTYWASGNAVAATITYEIP